MEQWTEQQEKTYQKRKQWFIDRIGKRVFREETSCQCKSCKNISVDGLVINDEMHALYLLDIESMYNTNGHKMKYRDA